MARTGQLHAPVASHPKKPFGYSKEVTQNQSGRSGQEKILASIKSQTPISRLSSPQAA
jgi:hypothetical protein